MREKRTFRAKMPTTQEAFADCVKEGKAVIVLKNSLLADLDKELNESKSNKGQKKVFKVLGKLYFVFGLVDPVMWIFSIASFLMGGILKDKIKEYNVHGGVDVNDANIIVFYAPQNIPRPRTGGRGCFFVRRSLFIQYSCYLS